MKKLLLFLFFISLVKLDFGQDLSGDWQLGSPLLNQSQSFYSFDGESDGEYHYFPPYGDFNIISCIKGHFHLDSDSITFRLESVVYYTDWSVERKAFNNVDLSEIIYWGNSIDSNRLARDMSPRSQIVWEVDSSHNVYGKQQYRPTTCNYWGLSSQQRTEKKINTPREYRAAFSYDDQNSGYLMIDGKKRAIRRITIDGEEFYYIFPQIE